MNDTIILNEIQKREHAKQDGTLASKDKMFEQFSQSIDKMAETRESLDDIYCPRCRITQWVIVYAGESVELLSTLVGFETFCPRCTIQIRFYLRCPANYWPFCLCVWAIAVLGSFSLWVGWVFLLNLMIDESLSLSHICRCRRIMKVCLSCVAYFSLTTIYSVLP